MQDISLLWKVPSENCESGSLWKLDAEDLVESSHPPWRANGAPGKFTQFINRAIAGKTPVQSLPALLGYGWV
jgi:hypothetical protein